MRPFALAASCAAILLAFGAHARADEPVAGTADKGEKADDKGEKTLMPAKEGVEFRTGPAEKEAPAYPPPSARWGVMGIGLATSGFFYGGAVGASYIWPDMPGASDLRKPIIGPWIAISKSHTCAETDPDCSTVWIVLRAIAEGIGGVAQAGGVLVMLEGVFMPTQYTADTGVRRAPKAPAPSSPPPSNETKPGDKNLFWIPTPMAMGARGVGVGVVGNF
jgi:hypothetical protein